MLLPNIGWAVFSHRLCIDVIRKCGSNICWFFFYSFECNMKLLTWMHNKPKNNYRKLMVIFINSFNFFFIYFFLGELTLTKNKNALTGCLIKRKTIVITSECTFFF